MKLLVLLCLVACDRRTVEITSKPGYSIQVHTEGTFRAAEISLKAEPLQIITIPIPLVIPINCQPVKVPPTAEKPL